LLTPIEEEYVRAFTELNSGGEIKFDENAKQMIDRIKNESIPFYVDHLFDTLGIKLSEEAESKAESVCLSETENFEYKDVLPSALSRVKLWKHQSEMLKQENIRKTPYLYQ
jgi:hypothetical protein